MVDIDGNYSPIAAERVLRASALAVDLGVVPEVNSAFATLDSRDLAFYAGLLGAQAVLAEGMSRVVLLAAGVHALPGLVDALPSAGAVLVPARDVETSEARALADRRPRPGTDKGDTAGLVSRSFVVLDREDDVRALRRLASNWVLSSTALDLFAVESGTSVLSGPLLVSPWHTLAASAVADGRLSSAGFLVAAVDLSGLDPDRPWLLDAHPVIQPRVLLSEHPALAELVGEEAARRRADVADVGGETTGHRPGTLPLTEPLRAEMRRVSADGGQLPDVIGLGGTAPDAWAVEPVPPGHPHPVARYLAAVRRARPQLRKRFPAVPGPDVDGLARWALDQSGDDEDLLHDAARRTIAAQATFEASQQPPPGVNLVGYLAGELGLGESVRLVDEALRSAGVATSAFDVSQGIQSRRGVDFHVPPMLKHDTSLLCVNGAQTPAVVRQLRDVLDGTRVIGMWYWELEEFPEVHRVGFEHVDEVWAATDFMRDAIAAAAGTVPVRTVTPPLPQVTAEPPPVPKRFRVPTDRPWFLFTFDFLSLAARKNPTGLVTAFTRAFADRPEDERPLLVIKTINAAHSPDAAEQLRLELAGRTDVRFYDGYLDHHERHALVARCTAYVSLHRAEGLGLTVAEAMAWGKPVITTAYGGVMQFCDETNAFLVDWTPAQVEETTGPYERGMRWAEPDLDHAAALMRLVVDEPDRARSIGEQAAADIRDKHNARVAGAHMRAALDDPSTAPAAGPAAPGPHGGPAGERGLLSRWWRDRS